MATNTASPCRHQTGRRLCRPAAAAAPVWAFAALAAGAGLASLAPDPVAASPAAAQAANATRRGGLAERAAGHDDLYGDPLPPEATARIGTIRFRPAGIDHFAFSPDGKTLATANRDHTVRLWDAATGKPLARLEGHRDLVFGVAFHPGGKVLASIAHDETVRLWDPGTGKELRRLSSGLAYAAHRYGHSRTFRFLPDGKTLCLFPPAELGYETHFWDVATGKPSPWPKGPVHGLAIEALSADGSTFAGADRAGTRFVWDRASGRLRGRVALPRMCVPVVLSADGRLVAAAPKGTAEPVLHVWDVASGKELFQGKGHLAFVSHLAFSPDGKLLASGGGRDLKVILWDLAAGRPRWEYQGPSVGSVGVPALAFSPDGSTVLAAGWDGGLRLLDAASGKDRATARPGPGGIGDFDFTAGGKVLFTFGGANDLSLWDAATGKLIRRLHEGKYWDWASGPPPDRVGPAACSPDGQTLAVGHRGATHLWDLSGRARPRTLEGVGTGCLAFSPDGKLLARGNRDLVIWDARTGRKLHEIPTDRGSGVYVLGFSPDGRLLVTAGGDRVVRLWDPVSGRQVGKCEPHPQYVRAVSFSPDGQTILTYSDDMIFRVWEVETLTVRARVHRAHNYLGRFAVSPDSRFVILNGVASALHFFDTLTGQLVHRHPIPDDRPYAYVFSPDGRALAVAQSGGTALILDAARVLGAIRPPAAPLRQQVLSAFWARLAEPDAAQAAGAMAAFSAASEQTVPFLQRTLPPAPPESRRPVGELIRDLDHKDFAARRKATEELLEHGREAAGAVRAALRKPPSLEARRRLEQILGRLERARPAPDVLRAVRAVEILERIGDRPARELLEALTGGAAQARLTREARAALQRLSRRTLPAP